MKTTRSSGIILHITSLPGPYGIGDLGPEAYHFADLLLKCGIKYWQILPLNPIDKGSGYSPYSSSSAFAGNAMLISPERLVEEGYLTRKDIQTEGEYPEDKVAYDEAIAFKRTLLRQAFEQFTKEPEKEKQKAFASFKRKHKEWLEDYAFYRVIVEEFEHATWLEWPKPLREREEKALEEFSESHREELEYIRFTQFLFYKQWDALRKYCNGQGLLFFGDLPFYVSFDSADVWANPEDFKLDANKKPVSVSGVPPDYFSETGQLWGTPVYDWEKLKAQKYGWWIRRLAHNLELFNVARLDHFRAFYDFWEVPADEETALNGKWSLGPADDFFKLLEKTFPDMPFIAEDLGEVGPEIYGLRDRFNLPGMAVLQYGFGDDIATSPFNTHNFTENIIVYTGTHDNNTTKGWFRKELKAAEKNRLTAYLDHEITEENVSHSLIKLALMSIAKLAIFPLQDFLDLDETAIMNKPSVGEGNWVWRVTKAQLKSLKPKEIKEMLHLYNRVPEPEEKEKE